MRLKLSCIVFVLICLLAQQSFAQKIGKYDAVYSGVPWLDDRGNVVSAHAANIMIDNGKYYLYGEAHSDTSNAFAGFNCYSSADLYNWKFESVALPVQHDGRLGPNRVGERPKVLRCPKTGEYIMLMHTDSMGYKDPCVGYATSATPQGPFVFKGPLLFNGALIKKWDMGSFQDSDGTGYLLVHGGIIYKLSDDYKSISEQIVKEFWPDCEAPAIFKRKNVYYWIGSNRTSWDSNDNTYYTASNLKGPWILRGNVAPKGTLTYDSQTTFVLPIPTVRDTVYLFMGDRWAFPKQVSSATYVWQPLGFKGDSIAMPYFIDAWQLDRSNGLFTIKKAITPTIVSTSDRASYTGDWHTIKISDSQTIVSSDAKNASFTLRFTGIQIGLYCFGEEKNGYASVTLRNVKGDILIKSIINTYSKYAISSMKFITPVLPKGDYTLTVSVTGEHAAWSDKKHPKLGSTGNFVSFDSAFYR